MATYDELQHMIRFGLDVGGSLAKVIYFEPAETPPTPGGTASSLDMDKLAEFIKGHDSALSIDVNDKENQLHGAVHFLSFPTKDLSNFIDLILVVLEDVHVPEAARIIHATGGGAHKYEQMMWDRLGVRLQKRDELSSLVKGLNFMFERVPDEVYRYDDYMKVPPTRVSVKTDALASHYPYLLVNIGSGVSILKVTGRTGHERVSGTSLGGGTFFGLAKMLTGAANFEEIMKLCGEGDNTTVDMLVGDIYGQRNELREKHRAQRAEGSDNDDESDESDEHDDLYERLGLDEWRIASFFGKVASMRDMHEKPKAADLALSVLRMISYNIGQIAYLNAVNAGLERIYFVGSFIQKNEMAMANITEAVDFWSAGEMSAFFVRHEGYFGAMGAFLIKEERIRRESNAQPPSPEAVPTLSLNKGKSPQKQ